MSMAYKQTRRADHSQVVREIRMLDDILRGHGEVRQGLKGLVSVYRSKCRKLNAEMAKPVRDEKLIQTIQTTISNLAQTLIKASQFHPGIDEVQRVR